MKLQSACYASKSMEDTNAVPGAPFPERVSDVPPEQRLAQTFGIGPTLWGLAFFAWTLIGVVQPAKLSSIEKCLIAASALVGTGLIAWDVLRRRNRIVLVVTPLDVAIYRKGRLDVVAPPGFFRQYVLNTFNTVRLLLPFLFGAGVGIFLGIDGKNLQSVGRSMALTGGCFGAAVCGSIAWTRILCSHFYLPRSTGLKLEYAMFSAKHAGTIILRDPRQALLSQQAAEVRRQRADKLRSNPPAAPSL
jgi:hypothetical protein